MTSAADGTREHARVPSVFAGAAKVTWWVFVAAVALVVIFQVFYAVGWFVAAAVRFAMENQGFMSAALVAVATVTGWFASHVKNTARIDEHVARIEALHEEIQRMERITMTTTTELRALLEKREEKYREATGLPDGDVIEQAIRWESFKDADGEFNQAARSALPDLLSAAEELERVREELREAEDAIVNSEVPTSGPCEDEFCAYCGLPGDRSYAGAEHSDTCIKARILARRASKESR